MYGSKLTSKDAQSASGAFFISSVKPNSLSLFSMIEATSDIGVILFPSKSINFFIGLLSG